MATPDQIPSDLTLELGDDLSPDLFMSAARAFFGYVEEVGRMVAPQGREPNWLVRVKEGSSLIGLDPAPMTDKEIVQAIYARSASGVRALAEGDVDAAALSEGAVRRLKVLADLASSSKAMAMPIRLWVEKQPMVLGADKDYGSVEGRLEAIQDHGGLELRIRDAALRITVKCHVPEEMLAEVFGNFRKRVEVAGLVRYRRDGTPVSIEATAIEALPDDKDLPTLQDIRGLLRAVG
jgi:hypothetical protein